MRSPLGEGAERRLPSSVEREQSTIDLATVGTREIVVEAEVAERVDAPPAARDPKSGAQPSRLRSARYPEVELEVGVVGGDRKLGQEQAEPVARPVAIPVRVELSGERVEIGKIGVAVCERRP